MYSQSCNPRLREGKACSPEMQWKQGLSPWVRELGLRWNGVGKGIRETQALGEALAFTVPLIPATSCEAGRINGSITEMTKLRLEEVQSHAQGPTAGQWQNWDPKPRPV